MSLFPIFLKLTARPTIVIGGGHLAESKIESLLAAQASVRVIAPRITDRVRDLADGGEIDWQERRYQPGDIAGHFLVVAATDDAAVNRAVFAEAEAADILCNAVDDPPFCDYYFPSVVRRGDLQIAISTAGQSPALAQRLRKEINALLPLDAGDWLMELGNLRREVLQLEPLNDERKHLLHRLAQRDVCAYDACPSRTMARHHAITNPRNAASATMQIEQSELIAADEPDTTEPAAQTDAIPVPDDGEMA
jgi:precorrin-2 dehydrogenase/sirohydrochlorin ferrochelatase